MIDMVACPRSYWIEACSSGSDVSRARRATVAAEDATCCP